MSTKTISTFEREIKNPKFKKAFETSFEELVLSELLIELMERNNKTVRQLAKEVHLSPTIIQKIRSGKQDDLKMSNFISISHACGYKLILEKGKEKITIE